MQFLRASRGRAHPHTAPAEAPRRGEAFGVRQPSSPLALWLRREERKDGLLCVDRKAAEGCRTPRRCRVLGHGTTWHFRRGISKMHPTEIESPSLRACRKTMRGAAARDFGRGQGRVKKMGSRKCVLDFLVPIFLSDPHSV